MLNPIQSLLIPAACTQLSGPGKSAWECCFSVWLVGTRFMCVVQGVQGDVSGLTEFLQFRVRYSLLRRRHHAASVSVTSLSTRVLHPRSCDPTDHRSPSPSIARLPGYHAW